MKWGTPLFLPTFTLVTRPTAATYPNRLIFVSDAAAGARIQMSDGSAWASTSAAGVNLGALSALTPDKLAWESPVGTDVVEFWGDQVDLPTTVLTQYFADNFATNTLADPTKWTKLTTGVDAAWVDDYFSTDHGAYQNTNNSIIGYQCLTNPRTADREVRMHYFGQWSAMRNAGVILSKFSANDIIGVNVDTNNVGPDPDWMAISVSAFNATTASSTTLATNAGWSAPVPDGVSAHWWLVGRKVGNTITGEVYTSDPAIAGTTPYASVTHVLSAAVSTRGSGGTDAGNHGAGVNNPVGYANGQRSNQATSHNYGEFRLLDAATATHRRLMAAITPTSGPRVQFPLFDLLPSGQGTSPINLQEVNTTGLTNAQIDALLSYAAANGVVLSDPTNKTLLVRQVGVWTKMAQLASPAFTGSPTAPTQPVADNSTKLATTAYTDRAASAGVAALSATTPDKVAWEYPPGTDAAEVYGQRAAAGLAMLLQDLFSTDTRASYSQEGVALNYPGTGVLTVTSGGQTGTTYWRPDLFATDVAKTRTQGSVGSSAGADGIRAGFKALASGRDMMAWVLQNGNVYIYYQNIVGGNTTNRESLGAVLSPLTLNHNYWIELTRAGNNRTVKVFDSDGVTVLYSNTGAIPAPAQAEFGAGQILAPAWGVDRDSAGGPSQVDSWEFWDAASETRDLMVAVTAPTSGTRTAKRLLGAVGSTGLRSDFAMLAGNGGLQLPPFTIATRPPAAGYGGSIIYVSDAAAGSKLQYSDGSAWVAAG